MIDLCPLCDRELTDETKSEHHLIPKSKKGKETVTIHAFCHRNIHATFTEKELARQYYTIDLLREQPEIQKFIKWVSMKPPDFSARTKDRK